MTITNGKKLIELCNKYRKDLIFREYVDTILAIENRNCGTIEEVWEAAFLSAYFRKRPEIWFKHREKASNTLKRELNDNRRKENKSRNTRINANKH